MSRAPAFRFAQPGDERLILSFIRGLAEYERMSGEATATEGLLAEWIFEKGMAEVLFALVDGEEVGFALFSPSFSTFLGRPGIHLEDLYVLPSYRGLGYGRALLARLAALAVERGCGRLEWACLDWNLPGVEFYRALGAAAMDEWTGYRLAGDGLRALAAEAAGR